MTQERKIHSFFTSNFCSIICCSLNVLLKRTIPNLPYFQEYFYKSQESLATVIDFVDEELDDEEEDKDKTQETSSTHSSPATKRNETTAEIKQKLTP